MRTKAEAEAKLARVGLVRPVAVADVTNDIGLARRAYQFTNSDGSETTVEIDSDPSQQQLSDLAENLPLPDRASRNAALAIMRAP